ncbi:uncharacterized protein LOC132932219 [Rhopalosiphum padi]|uniref:uncharacterized protein LOC132932219 n=1 Tax=Rhopalosiphum padi TaxID=40932 RepID=UPI00298D7227|nr:uncharacterized protein LOC132932219 [Rhopalosiphum padi]
MSKNLEENISSATNSEMSMNVPQTPRLPMLPTTADREPPQTSQHWSMTYGPPQPLAPQTLSVMTYHPPQPPLQLMTYMIPSTSPIPMAPDSVYMQMPLYRHLPPDMYQMQMPPYRNPSPDTYQTASAMPPPDTHLMQMPQYRSPPTHTYQMQVPLYWNPSLNTYQTASAMPPYQNPSSDTNQMQMPPYRNPTSDTYQTASAMPPYRNPPPHTYQMRMPYQNPLSDTYQMQLQPISPRHCVQPIEILVPMRPEALQVQPSHRLEVIETHVANMHQDVSFVQDEESFVPYYCLDCFTVMYSHGSVDPSTPLEIRRQPTVYIMRKLVRRSLDNEFHTDRHDNGDGDHHSDDTDPEFAASNPGP